MLSIRPEMNDSSALLYSISCVFLILFYMGEMRWMVFDVSTVWNFCAYVDELEGGRCSQTSCWWVYPQADGRTKCLSRCRSEGFYTVHSCPRHVSDGRILVQHTAAAPSVASYGKQRSERIFEPSGTPKVTDGLGLRSGQSTSPWSD